MATFTNVATLSYNGSVTNSNVVTGTITEVLAVTKTAVTDNYIAGDDVAYVISILNNGNTNLSALTVTDDLGVFLIDDTAYTPLEYKENSIKYYVNGVLQAAPTVTSGTNLVISGINVPANGNAVIVYEATVNEFAPIITGSTITNTVSVTGSGLTPVEGSETITVREYVSLSITKAVSPTVVTDNSQITYTFVIQNFGNIPVELGSDIVLSDTFDPILTNISATLNGTPFSDTNYTYSEVTGQFATDPGTISVPAATFVRDDTGAVTQDPGVAVFTITGTV